MDLHANDYQSHDQQIHVEQKNRFFLHVLQLQTKYRLNEYQVLLMKQL